MVQGENDDPVRTSRQLIAMSRDLVSHSRRHLDTASRGLAAAARRLDRTRNVLQAALLLRELRRRRHD